MQKRLILAMTTLLVIVGAYITSPARAAEYESVQVGDTVGVGWVCVDRIGAELILAALQYVESDSDSRIMLQIREHCVPLQAVAPVTGVFDSTLDYEGDKVTLVSVVSPDGRTFWSVVFPKFTIVDRPKSA